MKSPLAKQRELVIVLGSLFVFSSFLTLVNSFSPHLYHGNIQTQIAVEQTQEGVIDLRSPQEMFAFIRDLVESRSVEKIVALLKSFPPEKVVPLMGLIAQKVDRGGTEFNLLDLYELFAGAALVLKNNENYVDKLVKSLIAIKSFYQESFLYIVGSHPEYYVAVPFFIKAFEKAGVDINTLIIAAEKRLAASRDPKKLALFLKNTLPFSPETKKQLIWEIIMARAAADIEVLKQHGFDLNTVHLGKTPLMQAVDNNDEATVRALLKAGVAVNTIVNDSIGSALQRALITKNLPIELLLREYGARE